MCIRDRYYVSETNAPANVTGKTDDFLVSLPMTNVEGNDWIYDVHVFPKNKTTYGGVTLVKQGKEGTKAAVSLDCLLYTSSCVFI